MSNLIFTLIIFFTVKIIMVGCIMKCILEKSKKTKIKTELKKFS